MAATTTSSILSNEFTWRPYRRRPFTNIPDRPPTLSFMVSQVENDDNRYSQIRLYGVTMAGDSVHCLVEGFQHYFWCEKPSSVQASQLAELRDLWNEAITRRFGRPPIADITIEARERLMYYKPEGATEEFLKITLSAPRDLYDVRRYLRDSHSVVLPNNQRLNRALELYEEEGINYVARFMCSTNVVGFGWVDVTNYSLNMSRPSTCPWDIVVSVANLQAFTPDDDKERYGRLAPLRILDFDIECLANKGFPTPENDAVIMIAAQVTEAGTSTLLDAVLYTGGAMESLGGDNNIVMAHYDSETQLLLGFANLCNALDYDISRDFNGRAFDWPYLFDRAAALNIGDQFCALLSRLRDVPASIPQNESSAMKKGRRGFRDPTVPGRCDFDICSVTKVEDVLTSYKLMAVSMEFLGQTKEDVHHSMISVLYRGSPSDRARLARYCRKDARLCKLIDDKKMYFLRYVEQCRVCHVLLDVLIRQGQQAKVLALIAKMGLEERLVLPIKHYLTKYKPDGQFEGGLVLEPDIGFHKKPIVCLDFSSLYPSEGIAENYCYQTLLRPADVAKMNPADVTVSPAGHSFVKRHLRQGLLPRLWSKLLAARKVARDDMAACYRAAAIESDPAKKADLLFRGSVQNARQLAIKLVANAMYGFTGTDKERGGYLACYEVSEAITSSGRFDLQSVIAWLGRRYPGAKVRYGDTDSIMVEPPNCATVKEAMEWMHKVAAEINADLFAARKPMKLAPEKVMYPTLLQAKKHYICGYYERSPDTMDKIYYKGIEVVRRDACLLMKNCLTECCERIFRHHDIAGAVEVAKKTVERLYLNEVDLSELVISKSLSQPVEDYDNPQPHTVLAQKLTLRDPNNAPSVGDRIPYIMVGSGTTDVRNFSEDPMYALENEIPVNIEYYIENQLKKPLQRLFIPIIGADKTHAIFNGDHTRKRVKPTQSPSSAPARSIMSFVRVSKMCTHCRSAFDPAAPNAHPSLCRSCIVTHGAAERDIKKRKYDEIKSKYDEQFAVCQGCQGSDRDPVLCTATDCEIYYKRKGLEFKCKKAARDIEDIAKFM